MYTVLAPFYDEMMEFDYDSYMQTIQRFCPFANKRILEIGCGTGNVTQRLARSAWQLDAIDSSEEMLTVARRKVTARNVRFFLTEQHQIALHQTYDVILLTIDVLNYVKPELIEHYLQDLFHLLAEDGTIIFDLSTPYKLEHILGENTFYESTNRYDFIWDNHYDQEEGVLYFDLIFFIRENKDTYQRYEESHIQYAYRHEDILKICQAYALDYYLTEDRNYYAIRRK